MTPETATIVTIYLIGSIVTFATGLIGWIMTSDMKDPDADKITITCFFYFWAWPILAIIGTRKIIQNMKKRLEDNK